MTKSQIVNVLANEYGLSRKWLNQFQVQDLQYMLNDLRTNLKV